MNITKDNYLEQAKDSILKLKNLKDDKRNRYIPMLTTSKIRNLLAMSAEIRNDALTQGDILNDRTIDKINHLKVRFLYEAGRKDSNTNSFPVKNFVECTGILDVINNIGNSKDKYILFSNYFESLVAYHKYYGGKDN